MIKVDLNADYREVAKRLACEPYRHFESELKQDGEVQLGQPKLIDVSYGEQDRGPY